MCSIHECPKLPHTFLKLCKPVTDACKMLWYKRHDVGRVYPVPDGSLIVDTKLPHRNRKYEGLNLERQEGNVNTCRCCNASKLYR